jgi:IPT/TIG domain
MHGAVLEIGSSTQVRRPTNTGRKLTAVLAAIGLAACHAQSGSAPIITSVAPTTVNISNGMAVELTVHGAGFDSLNTVHFGRLVIPSVPRVNDSTVRFGVPVDDTFLTDRGPAPVQPLAGGPYDIWVETQRGRSNPLRITLVNDRGAR